MVGALFGLGLRISLAPTNHFVRRSVWCAYRVIGTLLSLSLPRSWMQNGPSRVDGDRTLPLAAKFQPLQFACSSMSQTIFWLGGCCVALAGPLQAQTFALVKRRFFLRLTHDSVALGEEHARA